jgi:hypothetical protein
VAVAVMRARPQGFVKEFISPLNSQGAVAAEIAGMQVGADGGFGGADSGGGSYNRSASALAVGVAPSARLGLSENRLIVTLTFAVTCWATGSSRGLLSLAIRAE